MPNQFHTLQIRVGLGPKPWGKLPESYEEFERDVYAARQRVPIVSTGQALAFMKEARATPRSDIVKTDALRERARLHLTNHMKSIMSDAVSAHTGFGDQLFFFWCNHFAARPSDFQTNPMFVAYQQEAIRRNMAGRFSDMLAAVDLHPLMLEFLSQNLSCGPNSGYAKRTGKGLNENLGREILELHTLGVSSNYNQKDVRELALLLTGTRFTPEKGTFFDPYWAEMGTRWVMNKRYDITEKTNNLDHVKRCLADLSLRPQTAWYICSKLVKYFCVDSLDSDLVKKMVDRWLRTQGNLMEVYKVLIRHPAVVRNYGKKVKWPIEYVASSMRVLGVSKPVVDALTPDQVQGHIVNGLNRMGQIWHNVPGPNGWDDNPAKWITPGNITARIQWANSFPSAIMKKALPDPKTVVGAALRGHQSQALTLAVSRASTKREATLVLLASNEFNRR